MARRYQVIKRFGSILARSQASLEGTWLGWALHLNSYCSRCDLSSKFSVRHFCLLWLLSLLPTWSLTQSTGFDSVIKNDLVSFQQSLAVFKSLLRLKKHANVDIFLSQRIQKIVTQNAEGAGQGRDLHNTGLSSDCTQSKWGIRWTKKRREGHGAGWVPRFF